MSINATVVKLDSGAWRFTWAAGTPPYPIWLDGILLTTIASATTYDCVLPGYPTVPPELEILNTADTPQNKTYPPYMLLQWRGVQGVVAYQVDIYTGISGSLWQAVTQIPERAKGYYQWKSPTLADESTARYRVCVIDLFGDEGPAIEFQTQVVCNPKGPLLEIEASGTNIVVDAPD